MGAGETAEGAGRDADERRTLHRRRLRDDDTIWELRRGRLRRRPEADAIHNRAAHDLAFAFYRQLPEREFDVRVNAERLR